ncbi:alpha/beta fold hydrolase [Apilactobacillus xinyiensis]|uniref:alpha/beta fold hydrolase n=1 Tax=Apilactobacillus xinyiensis TaxID=2841032 RepID=UPI0020353B68|nr:alpha/beta hydrolase [Apilactobacillus xinyiensis]
MASDALEFINALNVNKIDILSFSMGGMIAQEIINRKQKIVRKLILAGTGPKGGSGINNIIKINFQNIIKAVFTLKDVKTYLFFK